MLLAACLALGGALSSCGEPASVQETCESEDCTPRLDAGQPCGAANECASGFCADGVCCNAACDGACDRCSIAAGGSTDGVCSFASGEGAPSCGMYLCDGAQAACPTTCASDADCAPGHYCDDGACTPRLDAGLSCGAANECASGFCADGVCCNAACDGACDRCSIAAGGSTDGVCSLASDEGAPSCGTYLCDGAQAACPTTCAGDAECAPGHYCDDGACTPRLDAGLSCGAANECASGFCADGVCCNAACDGACDRCSIAAGGSTEGVCSFASGEGAPSCGMYLCDGARDSCPTTCVGDTDCAPGNYCDSGACTPRLDAGQVCAAANACASGFCADGVCCDSACDGACDRCSVAAGGSTEGVCSFASDRGAPSCGMFLCGGAQAACPTTCASDAGCAPGHYCGNGACTPKLGAGQLCAAANACASGFCADGVCCNAACDGACDRCSVAAGGSTDGVCSFASDRGAPSCGMYLCGGAQASCPTTCASDAGCAPGHYCGNGACTPKRGAGQLCAAANACASGFCADGVCCNAACDGACDRCSVAAGGTTNGVCSFARDEGAPSCGMYLCDGARAACPTTCAGDADCAEGFCVDSPGRCAHPACGNALVEHGEQCDTGAALSNTAPNACRLDCSNARCGDGVKDTGEQCDTGAARSDTAPNACRVNCSSARCGDGVVDTGEVCDGNTADVVCAANCLSASTCRVGAGRTFATIQKALDATWCAVVEVDPGVYLESLTSARDVTVRGSRQGVTTVDAAGSVNWKHTNATHLRLEDLKLKGCASTQGACVTTNRLTLTRVTISNVTLSSPLGSTGASLLQTGQLDVTDLAVTDVSWTAVAGSSTILPSLMNTGTLNANGLVFDRVTATFSGTNASLGALIHTSVHATTISNLVVRNVTVTGTGSGASMASLFRYASFTSRLVVSMTGVLVEDVSVAAPGGARSLFSGGGRNGMDLSIRDMKASRIVLGSSGLALFSGDASYGSRNTLRISRSSFDDIRLDGTWRGHLVGTQSSYDSSLMDVSLDNVTVSGLEASSGALIYGSSSYDSARSLVSMAHVTVRNGTPRGLLGTFDNFGGRTDVVVSASVLDRVTQSALCDRFSSPQPNLTTTGSITCGSIVQRPVADTRLGPLQDFGATRGHLPGAPHDGDCVNADPDNNGISTSFCLTCKDSAGAPLVEDQRGRPRPVGAGCDYGAVERQAGE